MTTALKGGEGSPSRPVRSLTPGKTRYPLYRTLGGPQGRSGQVRKILPPPGFDPKTVHCMDRHHNDYSGLLSARNIAWWIKTAGSTFMCRCLEICEPQTLQNPGACPGLTGIALGGRGPLRCVLPAERGEIRLCSPLQNEYNYNKEEATSYKMERPSHT